VRWIRSKICGAPSFVPSGRLDRLGAKKEQRSRSQQDFDDIINGVTLTRDPVSGGQREVWTTQYDHHWLSPTDKLVDTPTNNSPGINYRELENIKR
jgi:hypothetical protein